jgi:hypothetical protein
MSFLIIISLFLMSCTTYEKCISKYGGLQDTIIVERKHVIQKDSIITIIEIDSIPYLTPGDTVEIESQNSRAKIKYWRDMYKNVLLFQAECDSIVIRDTLRIATKPIFMPKPLTRIKKAWDGYTKASAIALPIVLFTIILLIKLRK